MEKIEFTIYLNEAKTVMAFQALVATERKYDIIYDPNNLYEEMLENIINGEYSVDYINYDSDLKPICDVDGLPIYQTFTIDGTEDSVQNIRNFIDFQENILKEYICEINEQPEIYPIFGVHLNGHGFGYGEHMMAPEIISKTISSVTKISNNAINNTNYRKYLREAAASYEIHIDATKRDIQAIELFTKIYNDIESKNLDKNIYKENSSKNVYKIIVDELGKLTSFNKLSSFNIFIDGVEKPLTEISYLHDFLKNPYDNTSHTYNGKLKSPDYENKTFELKTSSDHNWHCHFLPGKEGLFDRVIDPQNRNKTLKVKAFRKKAATLHVQNIIFS